MQAVDEAGNAVSDKDLLGQANFLLLLVEPGKPQDDEAALAQLADITTRIGALLGHMLWCSQAEMMFLIAIPPQSAERIAHLTAMGLGYHCFLWYVALDALQSCVQGSIVQPGIKTSSHMLIRC